MVKRVLILAAFGGYNLGDDAIVDESIKKISKHYDAIDLICLLYTSPSPRD